MIFNFLIRVYCDLPASHAKENVAIGTAYPIARDRILTARHVLAAKGEEIDLSKIELTWFYLPKIDGKRTRADPQKLKIAWDGRDAGWDAAILECPFPEGVSLTGNLLSRGRPETDERWESRGFAATGQRDDGRDPQPLKGATYACADDDQVFHLGVDDAAMFAEGWKGASGAPVFVRDRIMGVMVNAFPEYDARRIEAIPIFRLLDIPEFRDAVGLPEPDRIPIDPTRFQAKIVAILEREPSVLELLEEMLNHKDVAGEAISMPSGNEDAKGRATHLVDSMFKDFGFGKRLLELAIYKCMIPKDENKITHLLQIAFFYLTACLDRDGTEIVWSEYETGESPLIDARASSPGWVAFRVAAIRGEAPDFDLDRMGDGKPIDRMQIANPPPVPLEADPTEEYSESLAKFLFEKVFPDAGYRIENYCHFRRQINKKLKINNNPGGSCFIVLNDPYHEKNWKLTDNEMMKIASVLRSQYEDFFIAKVSSDPDVISRELEHLHWLWEILKKLKKK